MEIYNTKNEILKEECGEPIPAAQFYREIFPVGSFERKGIYEDKKANGIVVDLSGERPKRFTVTDDLDVLKTLENKEFVLIGGCSYFGIRKTAHNGSLMYAMIFDLDGVGFNQMHNIIHQMNHCIIPPATFIVNSGHGVHLYYVFEKPVPMYPQNQAALKNLKWALTKMIWTPLNSADKNKQYQSIHQSFRMVGTQSKLGPKAPIVAYRFGIKTTIEELCNYWYDPKTFENYTELKLEEKTPLATAQKKWPEWYQKRIIEKQPKGSWRVKRDLYDWWLRKIKHEAKEGHRYFCLMTLCIYAKKCGISQEELEKDVFDLVPILDSIGWDNPFTKEDAMASLSAFADSYITFPRKDIEQITGIRIEANKRNHLKQKEHLEIARAVRDVKTKQKGKNNWWEGHGRPKNSGTKSKLVKEWQKNNPEGKPKECIKELGLSKNTVYKWW